MNGHTGNNALIDLTVRRLRQEQGAMVPWINIWPLASSGRRNEAHGANAGRATGHGADPIGSVYEYFYPALTRRELATTEGTGKTFFGLPTSGLQSVDLDGTQVNLAVRVDDHCDHVVGGDPSLANPASGKIFADFIVTEFIKLVRHVAVLPAEHLVDTTGRWPDGRSPGR
jgi:creatinine amidohydrolase